MSDENKKRPRIINKHDIEDNWVKAKNFIPLKSELIVYDKDETHPTPRFKIGDGETNVNDLPFFEDERFFKIELVPDETSELGFKLNKTFEEILNAAIIGKFVYLIVPEDRTILNPIQWAEDLIVFSSSFVPGNDFCGLIIYPNNSIEVVQSGYSIGINGKIWNALEPVDFTEDIQQMIDAKNINNGGNTNSIV